MTVGRLDGVDPEAPERVTHAGARDAVSNLRMNLGGETIGTESLTRYIAQQEQSEREVADLRKDWERVQRLRDEFQNARDYLRTQLAAAERKAEGLRVELKTANHWRERHSNDAQAAGEQSNKNWQEAQALKAKLAESERKLGEAGYCVRCYHRACVCAAGTASTEPAGVEAGKAEYNGPKLCHVCGTDGPAVCPHVDPTPTETEAPARFRVGRPVLLTCKPHKPLATSGRIEHIEGVRAMVRIDYDHTRHWIDLADLEPEEPADPAPPKQSCPYADCDCSGCVFCRISHSPEARENCHCWCERRDPAPPKPGEKSLTRAELIAALRHSGSHGPAEHALELVAQRLEKGGGGT